MNDEERHKIEWDAFYAEENAKKVIAGFILVALFLGVILGVVDHLFGSPTWLNWIRP